MGGTGGCHFAFCIKAICEGSWLPLRAVHERWVHAEDGCSSCLGKAQYEDARTFLTPVLVFVSILVERVSLPMESWLVLGRLM